VTCGLPPESLMVRRRRSRGGARSQRRRTSILGAHLGRRRASTTPFPWIPVQTRACPMA